MHLNQMVPNRSSTSSGFLPPELWAIVFDILRWEFWSSLLSLNLSCRYLHHLVSPVLYRTIHVRFPHDCRNGLERRILLLFPPTPVAHLVGMFRRYREVTTTLSSLLEGAIRDRIYPYVRILILSYGPSYNKHAHDELLERLLENLPNLDIIRWRGISFPPRLFKIFNNRPPARFFFEGTPEKLVGHDLLMGASYITSLDITYTPIPTDYTDINRELGKIIISLPNLKRLILKQNVRGRQSMPVPLLPPGSTLPALRFLAFTNFDFDSKGAVAWAQCLRHRNLRHLSLDGTTGLSELIRALSSGCLSHLESFLIRAFDGLTHIKPEFVLTLDRFLQGFIKLQACTLCDIPKEVLHSVVRHQGGHLRQLRFVTSRIQTFWRLERAKMDGLLSPEEIEVLSAKLPLIERLGIDLVMGDKMPEDSLRAIARLSGPKYLEFNVPARYTIDPPRDWTTWLNASVAEETFRYVDTMKHGVPLKQLDIQLVNHKPSPIYYSSVTRLSVWCIYSCWRETETSNQVHVVRLPSKVGGLTPLTVQDLYGQTLDSAGLGDSDMAGFGSGIY